MTIERTYTIPLRKEWLKAPRYKRAKRAIRAVRSFLVRHMKSEEVKLGTVLNQEIWKDGIKNPPCRVKVNVIKNDEGVVRAELFGVPMPKPEEKKTEKAEKKTEKKAEKPAKTEAKPEEKTGEVKEAETKPEPKPAKKPAVKKAAPKKTETKKAKPAEQPEA